MDSDQLFHIKQLFYQGNYSTCISTATPLLPDPAIAVYLARSHLACSPPNTKAAIEILKPVDTLTSKAFAILASYVEKPEEETLEELRELILEIEGNMDEAPVRIAAATAFLLANELEESVDVLKEQKGDLECSALLTQIYLSLPRPDLAQKTYLDAKTFGDDTLLVQMMEAWVGMSGGGSEGGKALHQSFYLYEELLQLPAGRQSSSILTAHAVSHLLLGHKEEAEGDLSSALELDPKDPAALAVGVSLYGSAAQGQEYLEILKKECPTHPLVVDLAEKEEAFEAACEKWIVA